MIFLFLSGRETKGKQPNGHAKIVKSGKIGALESSEQDLTFCRQMAIEFDKAAFFCTSVKSATY